VPALVVLGHLTVLVVVLTLHPADRLDEVFGDQDLGAMALRGLNARLGRIAGRTDPPRKLDDDAFSAALVQDGDLEPRYYLEYPHANLVSFGLPWCMFGPIEHAPPALLDSSLGNLTNHVPRSEREREIWRQLVRATAVYRVALFLLLTGIVFMLWRGYLPDGDLSSSCWPLLLPCGLYYALSRFDVLPVFFTTLALALQGRQRLFLSGASLAAGALSKIFPGFLLPIVVRYLWGQPRGRRGAALFLEGFVLVAAVGVGLPLVREGFASIWSPYQWQMNRPKFMWTVYGYLLPLSFGGDSLVARGFRSGAMLLTLMALAWRPIPDLATLVRRAGVLVVVFVLLQNVFSPQWVIWFWPFVPPLLGRVPGLAALIIVLDLATIAIWPYCPSWTLALDVLQLTRLLTMLGIVGVLLRDGSRRLPQWGCDPARAAPASLA
jgi:hypothetical protein